MSIDSAPRPTSAETETDNDRYIIVSTDSHVGPHVATHLRDYCPEKYLGEYDEFVKAFEANKTDIFADDGHFANGRPFTENVKQRVRDTTTTDGVFDPAVRLADMDDEGVTTEVLFHGAATPEGIPWQGWPGASLELQEVGLDIYNRWLADFANHDPDRFIAAVQLPLWDIDKSIKQVHWAAENGMKCINFPAPNRTLLAYNDPAYEPFWQASVETGLALTTHGGSGDMPPYSGPETWALYMSDLFFYSRRGLWYLIWSGAFERHPDLKMIFVEQRSEWVPETLAHLDSVYHSDWQDYSDYLPKEPSEYFRQNCWVASSFMARFEMERRYEVGIDRFMWGTDYPHFEGSAGYTPECLRATFAGFPQEDVRKILGENAIDCFGLDRDSLRRTADRIGPLPSAVDQPLGADELPDIPGCSFRTRSTWS